jgi:hypothetical protein
MDKLVFLIKSFHRHLPWTRQLLETVGLHNKDKIKIYLSIPASEDKLFRENIDLSVAEIIHDEDVIKGDLQQNWHTQQLVKMKFHELQLGENYFWIDGDSYFIRDFFVSDFMYDSSTPYTTIHENKDLFGWMAQSDPSLLESVLRSYRQDRQKVMDIFGRKGRFYDWTCPNLWSTKVFEHMKENFLIPNNLTFENLLSTVPGELIWYGEYLLKFGVIPLVPCDSWFKPFHYEQQMIDCKKAGNTESTLSENYLGIVMPSAWTDQLRF